MQLRVGLVGLSTVVAQDMFLASNHHGWNSSLGYQSTPDCTKTEVCKYVHFDNWWAYQGCDSAKAMRDSFRSESWNEAEVVNQKSNIFNQYTSNMKTGLDNFNHMIQRRGKPTKTDSTGKYVDEVVWTMLDLASVGVLSTLKSIASLGFKELDIYAAAKKKAKGNKNTWARQKSYLDFTENLDDLVDDMQDALSSSLTQHATDVGNLLYDARHDTKLRDQIAKASLQYLEQAYRSIPSKSTWLTVFTKMYLDDIGAKQHSFKCDSKKNAGKCPSCYDWWWVDTGLGRSPRNRIVQDEGHLLSFLRDEYKEDVDKLAASQCGKFPTEFDVGEHLGPYHNDASNIGVPEMEWTWYYMHVGGSCLINHCPATHISSKFPLNTVDAHLDCTLSPDVQPNFCAVVQKETKPC